MGTGKTTAGRELAKKKKWRFVDLDELIELREGKTIPDIFSKKGEPYFRILEQRALKEVAREKKFVVACGGGIVVNKENIKIMKESGVVICLKANPLVILKRTSKAANRPLLNTNNPKERIGLLLKLRAPYYALADKSINTSNLTLKQVVAGIVKLIKK